MSINKQSQENAKKGGKMIQRSISIDLDLWERARLKAGLVPISVIIRELIKKWLDDEIEIK